MRNRSSGFVLIVFASMALIIRADEQANPDKQPVDYADAAEECEKAIERRKNGLASDYSSDVWNLKQKFQKAGDLEKAIAADEEWSRALKKQPLTAESLVDSPPELLALQKEYLERFAKISETAAREFLQDLQKEASQLAKAGRLAEGKILQQEIDTIKRLYLNPAAADQKVASGGDVDAEALYEDMVRRRLVTLQAEYVEKLGELERAFQADGALEDLFSVKAERQRYLERPAITEKHFVEQPDELLILQEQYAELQESLPRECLESVTEQLEKQKKTLTIAGQLDEAIKVKQSLEAFLAKVTATGNGVSSSTPSARRLKNSIGMSMVLVKPGEFLMGAGRGTTSVKIEKSFYMSQTEVTQEQWRDVMRTEPWRGKNHVLDSPNAAAAFITWHNANAFCQKLNELEENRKSAAIRLVYSLPTEAEWEYACRAGSQSLYSFGDDASKLSDYGWWGGHLGPPGNARHEQYSHPVGKKKPNKWQLFDMHGNQWEWCLDGNGERQAVMRGGSWNGEARTCESGSRVNYPPAFTEFSVGFRVIGRPEARVKRGAVGLENRDDSGLQNDAARKVTVDSRRPWQSFGDVKKGTRLTLSAEGTWVGFSPDGDRLHSFQHDPVPSAPSCALLGRIGGQVFVVGSGTSVVVGKDGALELRINDADQYLFDNSGTLNVLIKESRRR
jgi:formylglycine-generating enzyme required for sulfatase activity